MTDLRQKLLATFQLEHREHVEQIRALVTQAGTGALAAPAIEEAFRRAHSLKGAARAVDLRPVETLAHRLETLFSRVREGKLELDGPVRMAIVTALEASEDWSSGRGEGDSAVALLNRLLGLEPEPSAPDLDATLVAPLDTVRIAAQDLDRLMRSAAEMLAESWNQGHLVRGLEELERRVLTLEAEWRRGGAARLDTLHPRVRELSRHARDACRAGRRAAFTLNLRSRQLEQDVWRARMVTAGAVLEGFHKMVRDLARDERKEIEFTLEGLGAQADRAVLEALKDPVMHLLRNAVVHGIERPEERGERGKPRAGRVVLRVAVRGRRLEVVVEDDGRGLDLEAVREAAVRGGLLAAADAPTASPERLTRLIFSPGLSTTRTVTELAGRGMGLSVVAEQLRRLQGQAEVRPRTGGGLSFVLLAPLSVATHRLLLVACRGHRYAFPLHAVGRVCRFRLPDLETVEGRPVLRLDGGPVPVLPLARLLGFEEAPVPEGYVPAVVLRWGDRQALVAVDALVEEREAVIQQLGLGHNQGGLVLEDGTVALVLDPYALLEALDRAAPGPLLQAATPLVEPRARSVLVVDDSITTRSLEKSILEAHGYQVRVAVDGADALEQLRVERPDLIIADIQMPRLDGFGLLEQLKQDPGLASIPVILVTSLERPEDQERGLALGADAYILKRKFDQRELLETIRQMV